MLPLSPRLLISAAQAFLGLGEDPGPRPGQVVQLFLHGVRQPDTSAWGAAFIHHAGYWSHFDARVGVSSWPLPGYGDCDALGRWCAERGVLLSDEPIHGDICLFTGRKRESFNRAAIFIETVARGGRYLNNAPYIECLFIEGNTGRRGEPMGPEIVLVRRKFSTAAGDRVIRWMALDPRLTIANPSEAQEVEAGRIVAGPLRRAA